MQLQPVHDFLIDLKFNNNRNWFDDNKSRYIQAKNIFEDLISGVISQILNFDAEVNTTAKESIYRIYRDVRFSKNKEPYKPNFGAYIARDGRKSPFAGYYLHFEPDHSFMGGGIYRPDSSILKAVRTEIYQHPDKFKNIINEQQFAQFFKLSAEDKLKTAPRDFPKTFPDLELLNYKHYVAMHSLSNDFWSEGNLTEKISSLFRIIYPFNQYLNNIIEN